MKRFFDAEILAILVEKKLAVPDLGDGAWGWTDLGKKDLSGMDRMELSNMLYGKPNAMSDLFWPELQERLNLPKRAAERQA